MDTVTRIYSSDLSREAPVIETGITRAQLDDENADGGEHFAALVWQDCERAGFYNDSDISSDVLCIYVAGSEPTPRERAAAYLTPTDIAGILAANEPEVTPTCDICGEEWEDGGEGEDWNGETGNHHSCEAGQ